MTDVQGQGFHSERHLDRARAHLRDLAGPIIDLGCGDGLFMAAAPNYFGLDVAPATLRAVRGAGRGALAADFSRVPLRDGSCAGVLCVNALHNAADPLRVLEEIDRVLGPGGRAYLKSDWYKADYLRGQVLRREARRWSHRLAFLLHRLLPGSRSRFRVRRTSRGTAVCPHCVVGFFRSRGYSFERWRRYTLLLTKDGGGSDGPWTWDRDYRKKGR